MMERIYIKHKRKECCCPACGTKTDRIHDYRQQKIKDMDIQGTPVILHLSKRRYVCTTCGKRFYESIPYMTRYARMTKRMRLAILEDLTNVKTFTDVARTYGVSITTVERIFDVISYAKPEKLPPMLSIDEFKGDTGGEKYNCIIADPLNHVVLDILPDRHEHTLLPYFLQYPEENRKGVEYFISDMWKPFQDTAKTVFKHSLRVIDKYHWVRQVIWAFERVRKDIQKHMSSEKRIYFKHSRSLLIKSFASLSEEEKQAVNVMLYYSADLSTAHFYKEEFQKICHCNSLIQARKLMDDWIDSASACDVKSMETCAKTMLNWKTEILNSFKISCTNGFVEGCNNKIKVLKRISYGYRSFKRFRNRILYIFNNPYTAANSCKDAA